jgi:hypothetical protein
MARRVRLGGAFCATSAASASLVVGAQHEPQVLDDDDEDQRPHHQREHAEHVVGLDDALNDRLRTAEQDLSALDLRAVHVLVREALLERVER